MKTSSLCTLFHLRKCFDGSKLFLRPSTKYCVLFLMLALVEAMCCYSALLLTGVVASQPCLGFWHWWPGKVVSKKRSSDSDTSSFSGPVIPLWFSCGDWSTCALVVQEFHKVRKGLKMDPKIQEHITRWILILDITRSVCPAGAYCAAQSGAPVACPVGYWCPPGSTKPQACPAKHDCCMV